MLGFGMQASPGTEKRPRARRWDPAVLCRNNRFFTQCPNVLRRNVLRSGDVVQFYVTRKHLPRFGECAASLLLTTNLRTLYSLPLAAGSRPAGETISPLTTLEH
jgi:hypothetical protein